MGKEGEGLGVGGNKDLFGELIDEEGGKKYGKMFLSRNNCLTCFYFKVGHY